MKNFELILRNGVTQKEFSEETGISQSTISDWKRKGTNPSADKILKICEVLKVTPYELLGENEIERKAVDLEMCAANTEEKMILEGFRNLPDRKRNEFWDIWRHCRRNKRMQKPSVNILASQMRKIFQKSEIFYRESLLGVIK